METFYLHASWHTTRVVMNQDDRRRHTLDGRLEQLGHPHLGRVQAAMVDLHDVDHPVTCVQQDHPQVLLFQIAHLVLQHGSRIRRAVDRRDDLLRC